MKKTLFLCLLVLVGAPHVPAVIEPPLRTKDWKLTF
jgi:hypothetical protein